jgi:hypothetical protein
LADSVLLLSPYDPAAAAAAAAAAASAAAETITFGNATAERSDVPVYARSDVPHPVDVSAPLPLARALADYARAFAAHRRAADQRALKSAAQGATAAAAAAGGNAPAAYLGSVACALGGIMAGAEHIAACVSFKCARQ